MWINVPNEKKKKNQPKYLQNTQMKHILSSQNILGDL